MGLGSGTRGLAFRSTHGKTGHLLRLASGHRVCVILLFLTCTLFIHTKGHHEEALPWEAARSAPWLWHRGVSPLRQASWKGFS